jgi:hypothetical protein
MQEREDSHMKKTTCVAAVIACVAFLLAACSPPPVEELNQPFSNDGLRMTATDMRVEPCPLEEGYLVVTTYFLVKNTTLMRTISAWVESGGIIGPGDFTDKTTHHLDDMAPRSSVEFHITLTVPADAVQVRHNFRGNSTSGESAMWLAYFWLPIRNP